MRMIAAVLRFCFFIVEKLTWELALLAALFSTTEGGSYFDRIVGGMFDNFWALYGFGKAYAINMPFADFMASLQAAIEEGIKAVNLNVESDSSMVLFSMLLTFVAWKLFAYCLRLIRKNLLKRGGGGGGKEAVKKLEPREATGGRTYQQLYEKQQPQTGVPAQTAENPEPQG